MSTGVVNYIRKVLFRVRWLTMSDRERYTYLWNRTRSGPGFGTKPSTVHYASSISFPVRSLALETLDEARTRKMVEGARPFITRHQRLVANPSLNQAIY